MKYTAEVIAEHGEKGARKVMESLGDMRLYECPVSYISPETREIVRLVYLIDDSKHLLHPGGWGEQPCWLIEAIEIHRVESANRLKEAPKNGSKN